MTPKNVWKNGGIVQIFYQPRSRSTVIFFKYPNIKYKLAVY